MAYSIYKGSTNISNYVTDCPPVPIIDSTHDNVISLPSMNITVIWNATTYAKDEVIYFKDGTTTFARFIIEDIDDNYEANTRTLSLVDQVKLLERYYVKDLIDDDYEAAHVTGDIVGGRSKRFAWWGDSEDPHRINFVTLTHFIATALIKAGICTAAQVIKTGVYGTLQSGFIRWDPTGNVDVPIYLEELCFQPAQIHYAKLVTGSEPVWEGATLLEVVIYALMVMNCRLKWNGANCEIVQRAVDADPADDDVYSFKGTSWLNSFDLIRTSITGLVIMRAGLWDP
jgi:hypothetical protein